MKNQSKGFLQFAFIIYLFSFIIIELSSCQKCQDCTQYCAYCQSSNGVIYKFCATGYTTQGQVDSLYTAFRANGNTCSLLNNDKHVCDRQINSAVDYYLKQDYYCVAK